MLGGHERTLLDECNWLRRCQLLGWADEGVTAASHLNGLNRISMQGPGQVHQGGGVKNHMDLC